jgi:hypothetical protein
MRTRIAFAAVLIACSHDVLAVDREYHPYQLSSLYADRHAIELKIFHLINEAAVRRDPRMKSTLALYGDSLGYIPSLAAAHYAYAFGDKSRVHWVVAKDKKRRLGSDSLVLLVFGYMDEWDHTVRRLREHADYWQRRKEGGAGEQVLHEALENRKRLYGVERFERVWKPVRAK